MGAAMGTERHRFKEEELERLMDQLPPNVNIDHEVPYRGWWIFSTIAALVAIPVGIKRKSLGPLLFYGTTGMGLDVIFSIQEHGKKREEWLRDYVAKHGGGSDGDSPRRDEILEGGGSSSFGDADSWTDKKRKGE